MSSTARTAERGKQARSKLGAAPARNTVAPRSAVCAHPKDNRSLLAGYDVVCGDCEQVVGRVALFPDAVLGQGEARELLRLIGDAGEGSNVRAKLVKAANRG